jgi:glycosyltransferase involved in cell wall biosynthesis
MQGRGHQVQLVVGGEDGPFFPLLDQAGLSYTRLPSLVRPVRPASDWRCVRELKQIIGQQRPDLVHCHSSKAGILGRYAASRCGVPAIFSAHGWSFTDGINPKAASVFLWSERLAARWCEKILVGCESDRQMGLAKRVATATKIETIWYGIHNLDTPDLARPEQTPPNLVMVARFEEQKDHETLLRGLAEVRHLEWSIDLLGDGPLRPAMEKLAGELQIAQRVRFVGVQPTKDYLLKSQLALMITNWEGLPLSTLEAMRVGLPLIGTSVGGIPEQITDGESGYLVPRKDWRQLAARLESLLSDPELRLRLGRAGKARFDQDFQYSRMLDRVEHVYRSACRQPATL